MLIKEDDKFVTQHVVMNPVKIMKLMNVAWKYKGYICKLPVVEGSEEFVNAGVGNVPRGLQAPTMSFTMEYVMEEGIKMGHTSFQLFFGNKGWEPSVAFVKKEFKKVYQKYKSEISFVQQVGDYIYYDNTFQGNRKSVHLSKEEIASWIQDW